MTLTIVLDTSLANATTVEALYRIARENEALSEAEERQVRSLAELIEVTILDQHADAVLRPPKTQTLDCRNGTFTVNTGAGCSASSSTLGREEGNELGDYEYNAGVDAIERFLLALAATGLRIDTPPFAEAMDTALDALGNQFADDDYEIPQS